MRTPLSNPSWEIAFGKRLQQARLDARITQKQAAQAAGVVVNTRFSWEQGTRTPRLWRIERIAAAVGVPFGALLVDAPVAVPVADVWLSPQTSQGVRIEAIARPWFVRERRRRLEFDEAAPLEKAGGALIASLHREDDAPAPDAARPLHDALDQLPRDRGPTQIGRDPHPDQGNRLRVVTRECRHHSHERASAFIHECRVALSRPRTLAPMVISEGPRVLNRLEKCLRIASERMQADGAETLPILGRNPADHALSLADPRTEELASGEPRRSVFRNTWRK